MRATPGGGRPPPSDGDSGAPGCRTAVRKTASAAPTWVLLQKGQESDSRWRLSLLSAPHVTMGSIMEARDSSSGHSATGDESEPFLPGQCDVRP